MTNKITLDPQLVRTIYNLDKFPDAPKIQINSKWIGIEFYHLEKTPIRDISDFAREYATWFDIDLPQIYIDIHRFKDKAIEWCAGKGWAINRFQRGGVKRVGVHKDDIDFVIGVEYPDMLSAELAVISFAWEQIQKEKKDEN